MRSRSFSLYAFLFSAAATTAIFALLGSPTPKNDILSTPTPITVHARTITDDMDTQSGAVLGESVQPEEKTSKAKVVEKKTVVTQQSVQQEPVEKAQTQKETTPPTLPNLTPNYFQNQKAYSNTTNVFSVTMPESATTTNTFVRVIESYTHDLLQNEGWRQVTKAREFQLFTPEREFISRLNSPVTVTAKYHKEHLGSVSEESLTLFYWSYEKERWIGLTTYIDTETQTVSAKCITPNVRIAVFGT